MAKIEVYTTAYCPYCTRAKALLKSKGVTFEEIDVSADDALREKMIVGTPERVADRLTELREELGINGILAELNPGGLIPHERVMNALRLLCEEVMPRFK